MLEAFYFSNIYDESVRNKDEMMATRPWPWLAMVTSFQSFLIVMSECMNLQCTCIFGFLTVFLL